jgi:hypothetical protein
MDNVLARLFDDDSGKISRRTLLQTLGVAAVGAPLAASLGTSALAQGGCRDGYAQPQGRCTLTKEVATAPITPVFEPTGWKTVGLDHLTFEVADYRKEAAFYVALMGWTLRSAPRNSSRAFQIRVESCFSTSLASEKNVITTTMTAAATDTNRP